MSGIWVCDPHFAKCFRLQPFHQRRIRVGFVIEAQQMQGAVHEKMAGVIGGLRPAASASARQVS